MLDEGEKGNGGKRFVVGQNVYKRRVTESIGKERIPKHSWYTYKKL